MEVYLFIGKAAHVESTFSKLPFTYQKIAKVEVYLFIWKVTHVQSTFPNTSIHVFLKLPKPNLAGDTSLETMGKHMRRILQPCDVDLEQDALMVDNDLNVIRPASVSPDDADVKVDVGEAQVAPKKKGRIKRKKGRAPTRVFVSRATELRIA